MQRATPILQGNKLRLDWLKEPFLRSLRWVYNQVSGNITEIQHGVKTVRQAPTLVVSTGEM